MPRRSKGYSSGVVPIKGKWYGRLKVKRPDGSWKQRVRQGRNKTHAKDIAAELEREYLAGGIGMIDAEDMTVADLAEHYRRAKVVDATFDGDIKVAGMMPLGKESAEKEIKALLEYWSARPIQKIAHADLEEYKIEMLRRPVVWRWRKGGQIEERQRAEPRKMSSVNHLLRRLKAMLNWAKRKGWLTVNPFNQGESLISEAAEIPRNRAEKAEELQKLLDACIGRRAYLRPIILIMADSSLRLTEAKRLTRAEIDFEEKVARVRARNTKRNIMRSVPLSDRLCAELRQWCDQAESDDVPILRQSDHKKAWKTLKKDAGIRDGLQLRDLRGWGASRTAKALAAANLPWEWGMKITGHTQTKTYQRYLKTDDDVAKQAGEALKNLEDKAA
jgi:integrase